MSIFSISPDFFSEFTTAKWVTNVIIIIITCGIVAEPPPTSLNLSEKTSWSETSTDRQQVETCRRKQILTSRPPCSLIPPSSNSQTLLLICRCPTSSFNDNISHSDALPPVQSRRFLQSLVYISYDAYMPISQLGSCYPTCPTASFFLRLPPRIWLLHDLGRHALSRCPLWMACLDMIYL